MVGSGPRITIFTTVLSGGARKRDWLPQLTELPLVDIQIGIKPKLPDVECLDDGYRI
jgi:hypothetical protein